MQAFPATEVTVDPTIVWGFLWRSSDIKEKENIKKDVRTTEA